MLPILILLVFASFAHAFTWQTITSGNRPFASASLQYNNVPLTAVNDTLFVATSGGLLIRTPSGDRMWTVSDGTLTTNIITTVAISSTDGVWVGCGDGSMAHLYPRTMNGELLRPFVNDIDVHEIQLIREHQGQLLVSTDAGISRLRYNNSLQQWVVAETYRDFGTIGRNPLVYDIQVIHDTVWVSTSRGLVYGQWNNPQLISPLSWHKVTGFISDETYNVVSLHDTLFIANTSGCYRIDDTTAVLVHNGWTHQIAVWNDSLIMIGVSGIKFIANDVNIGGNHTYPFLITTPSNIFTYYSVPDTSSDTTISGYASFSIATRQWLIKVADTPLYPNMLGATRRSDGTLVAITGGYRERGLDEYENGHWHYHTRYSETGKAGFFRQDPLVVVPGADSIIWVGSLGGGIGIFYKDSMQYFDHTAATGAHLRGNSYNIATVPAIGFLSTGRVVLIDEEALNLMTLVVLPEGAGTRRGWENGAWTYIGPNVGLNMPNITRLAVDPWDRVWVAAAYSQQRLTAYDFKGTIEDLTDDESHTYGSESGLPADLSIQSMAFGSDGTLYLVMSGSLYYGHIGENLTGTAFYPLQLPLPATSATSLAADAAGQIWVGTTNGLALLAADGQSWVTIFNAATPTNLSGLSSNNIGSIQFLASTGEMFIQNEGGIAILQTPFRQTGQRLGNIVPIPNPFRNEGSNLMKFGETGLVTDADIRIFTPSGLLIRRLGFLEAAGNGWNGRNQAGNRVATGIYFIIVTTPDGKVARGKVAVITP